MLPNLWHSSYLIQKWIDADNVLISHICLYASISPSILVNEISSGSFSKRGVSNDSVWEYEPMAQLIYRTIIKVLDYTYDVAFFWHLLLLIKQVMLFKTFLLKMFVSIYIWFDCARCNFWLSQNLFNKKKIFENLCDIYTFVYVCIWFHFELYGFLNKWQWKYSFINVFFWFT